MSHQVRDRCLCRHLQRAAESLPYIDEANRLSPKDAFAEDFHLHYAFAYIGLGHCASGLEHGIRSHRARPKHPYPVILSMICAGYCGELELAAELSAKLQQLAPFMTREMLSATCPYFQPDDATRFAEGIRLAGHP